MAFLRESIMRRYREHDDGDGRGWAVTERSSFGRSIASGLTAVQAEGVSYGLDEAWWDGFCHGGFDLNVRGAVESVLLVLEGRPDVVEIAAVLILDHAAVPATQPGDNVRAVAVLVVGTLEETQFDAIAAASIAIADS